MQFSNCHIDNKRLVWGILALTFVVLSSMSPEKTTSHKIKRVVLDAGHGGKDPGNLGTGRYNTTEKDITLDVTMRLGKYIEENFPDVEVIFTRNDDSYPSLNDRVVIANDHLADLFISIHCDAFSKKTAHGSGTFVMGMHKTEESLRVAMQENASIYNEDNYEEEYLGFDPKDPDTYIALTLRQNAYLDHSLKFGEMVQKQFKDRVGRVDRGVRQAGYYVICFTTMPSALVELGFLTNTDEEDFLNSEQGKSYMASAIFRAFKEYKMEIEGVVTDDNVGELQKDSAHPSTPSMGDLIIKKVKKGVAFEVQILTSSQKLKSGEAEFKGIKSTAEYAVNGVYKYTAGRTDNYDEAKRNQKLLRDLGFSGAFIIATKDGHRIDLREALSQSR